MYSIDNVELQHGNFKRMTGNNGKIVFSQIEKWHNKGVFLDISIKYVLKGTEFYFDSYRNQYKVQAGEFLLGRFEDYTGESIVNSSATVDGICLYIKPEILAEVYNVLKNCKQLDLDILTDTNPAFPNFFNNIFIAKHTPMDALLRKCGEWFYSQNAVVPENLFNEFLYEVAEKIVLLQFGIRESLIRFDFLRPSTRNEILKRLLMARNFMDDNFLVNPSLAEISSAAGLSKYHFLRSFKQAYTQTPFEYVQDKRLEYAMAVIQNGGLGLKGIAHLCSFSDIASFSKAFKRKFGMPPSSIQKGPLKNPFFTGYCE